MQNLRKISWIKILKATYQSIFAQVKKNRAERVGLLYQHEVYREDWEQMLDEIFGGIMMPWRHGRAIISNTKRKNSEDHNGKWSEELTIRRKPTLPKAILNPAVRLRPTP